MLEDVDGAGAVCGGGSAVVADGSPLTVLVFGSTYSTCNVALLCLSSRCCFASLPGDMGETCLMAPDDGGCCGRDGSLTEALRPSWGAA